MLFRSLSEMVTGHKTFEGKTPASVMSAILSAEPAAISTLQSLAPPALDRVVKKCLAKDPDARWQTARDLHDALKWITDDAAKITPTVTPSRARWHQYLPWTLAAGGASDCSVEIAAGSTDRIADMTLAGVLPSKALWPVTISCSTAPNPKMSVRASASWPSTCSGAM